MLIFGTIGIVRRSIPFSSGVTALARGVIGTLFLLLVLVFKREPFDRSAVKKNFGLLCLSGACLGGNWALLFEAYRYTTVSTATMCYYMAPVIILLVSPLLFHEKLSKKNGLCVLAAVSGMALVSGVFETEITGLRGIAFGLGAAVLYAGVVLLNKKISGISANIRTVFQLGISALALLPYVLFTEDFGDFSFRPETVGLLLLVGIVHTGISYALYFDSIWDLQASTVALFSYIDPVFAVILSVLVLKERLSAASLAGILLVLGAAAASELPEKNGKNKETEHEKR